MRKRIALLFAAAVSTGAAARRASEVQHFVFFDRDRERITEPSFLDNPGIAGAQLKYTWRELEPERDRYHFEDVISDLTYLQQHGKKLFVQLQDVSFSENILVPDYLLYDPTFAGGVARKYEGAEPDLHFDGWVARRWDPAVRDRFGKLLMALGSELDGRIEGIALAETATSFGDGGSRNPSGFTPESYVEGVKAIMSVAREAFPQSCAILYANFMPGEWLPGSDHGYLRAIYSHAERIGMGVGGPDLRPYRRGQLNHSYPLIAARSEKSCAGVAVQDGNLDDTNPTTGQPVTIAEMHEFAKSRLRLNYIFWGTQEPHYSQRVLPYLKALANDSAGGP